MVTSAEPDSPEIYCHRLNDTSTQLTRIDVIALSPIFQELVAADLQLRETIKAFKEACQQSPRTLREILGEYLRRRLEVEEERCRNPK